VYPWNNKLHKRSAPRTNENPDPIPHESNKEITELGSAVGTRTLGFSQHKIEYKLLSQGAHPGFGSVFLGGSLYAFPPKGALDYEAEALGQ